MSEFPIHPVPESTDYRAYLFRSFGAAVEATREMVQADVQPTILRATDAPYTEMAFHTLGGALQKAGAYVRGGLGVVGYGVPGASLMSAGTPAMARNQLTRRRTSSLKAAEVLPALQALTLPFQFMWPAKSFEAL